MTSNFSCPLSREEAEVITLAHGSGGKESSRLMEKVFLPSFSNPHLDLQHDGAFLTLPSQRIVFTTDSYVVQPCFFPGGDIGKLAITGTVNDLAMCGARPLYISCGFILEEGFLQSDLKRVVQSMEQEARLQGVQIVTGDTKVIERRGAANLFLNTSGIGVSMVEYPIDPFHIRVDDAILLSGDIGRHGMAVMAQREGLSFTSPLVSDCASLFPLVHALVEEGIEIHCLRDATRGGLATVLIELAESAKMNFLIDEKTVPISPPVHSACEMLGLDPFFVANEGCCVACVPPHQAECALRIMRRFPEGKEASLIGRVVDASPMPHVALKTVLGSSRSLRKLMGDQLPRIC